MYGGTVQNACIALPIMYGGTIQKGKAMKIVSSKDKRVKALIENPGKTSVKGLDKKVAQRVADMIAAIRAASHPRQLQTVAAWRVHELAPKWPGKWSMMVTGNYRLTFRFDPATQEASDLDFEDYH